VVGDTASGSGSAARAHILVKPVAAGLRTNLMIATDRRTYHLDRAHIAGASRNNGARGKVAKRSEKGPSAAARTMKMIWNRTPVTPDSMSFTKPVSERRKHSI